MYNYSKSFLEKMSSETGFIRDNLEKVFRMCDILQFLNTHPVTKEYLTLKGGTAINLTVFNFPRLSVDIDFDFCGECNREEMLQTRSIINEDILNYMFAQGYALSPNTKNPHSLDSWVFYFQNAGGNKDNIKVEINYSMRNHILPILLKKVQVDFLHIENDWKVLSTIELYGGKIKALIERTAPRDLFDVYNMVNANIIHLNDKDLLRKIIIFYLVIGSKNKLVLPFHLENINSIKFCDIKKNLIPVLRKNEPFDFETAKTIVLNFLSELLIPSDKEKMFIEQFYQNKYQPDLLFDDSEIITRIKNHPMAVWKTKAI
jgi:predicted nucleotidyltransferase component of viral defense system